MNIRRAAAHDARPALAGMLGIRWYARRCMESGRRYRRPRRVSRRSGFESSRAQPARMAQTGDVAWPLVGRDAELHAVGALLADRTAGGVVVAGPAGVGKTRLAVEAARLAAAPRTARCEWVRATRSAASIPLGALAPLLPPEGAAAAEAELLARARRSLIERGGRATARGVRRRRAVARRRVRDAGASARGRGRGLRGGHRATGRPAAGRPARAVEGRAVRPAWRSRRCRAARSSGCSRPSWAGRSTGAASRRCGS